MPWRCFMRKIKLSIDDQIKYMKDKSGIKFNVVNEDEARDFLINNNYYFKVKSYAKNYDKYSTGPNKGKYVNLEFAYLMELSRIDMYFRRFVMKITLDIEHFLKTQLLSDLSENNDEDGYDIVSDLFCKYPYIKSNLEVKSKNSACSDLIVKYRNDFAVWNLVETLSFGDFTKLYEIYYKKYKSKSSMENYLWSVKFLRNAAAHNSCLINSLKNPYSSQIKANSKVNTFISKIDGINPVPRKKKMSNPVVHDFIVTLYVFNKLVKSRKAKKNTMEELKTLMDVRFKKNKSYFEQNEVLTSNYVFVKKIVDYFYDFCL